MGVDQIVDKLVKKLGHVKSAYIVGDYATGQDSGLIDIAFSKYSREILLLFIFELIKPRLFRIKISIGLTISPSFNIRSASSFSPRDDNESAVAL